MGHLTRAAVEGSGTGVRSRTSPPPPVRSSLMTGAALSLVLHLVVAGWALSDRGRRVVGSAQPTDEMTYVALEIVPKDIEESSPLVPPASAVVEPTTRRVRSPRNTAPGLARSPSARSRAAAAADPLAIATPGPAEIPADIAPAAPPPVPGPHDGQDQAGSAPDEAEAAAAPMDSGPRHVASYVAAALRVYDHFPRIPEPLRNVAGEYPMLVDVCVSERGQVSQVNITPTGVELLERTLREAVHTWRYRPLVIGGTPRPFCHSVRVIYRAGSV